MNEKETNGLKWFSLDEILSKDFETFDDVKVWCQKIAKSM